MDSAGFSPQVPGLCLVWDASRLAGYMKDPLAYYWHSVLGYRTTGFASARDWGTLYHEATALFEKMVFGGSDREMALKVTVKRLVIAAIETGFPLRGGKGKEAARTVETLVRALVWFETEYRERPLAPLPLKDGTPALEYNWVLPLGLKARTGEDYLLAGNIDKIGTDDDGHQYAVERKTTTTTLGKFFFSQYDPGMQTYMYDVACAALFPDASLRGVIIEACQTGVEFCRFDRHAIVRTRSQREHWVEVIKYWIRRAEQDAIDNSWGCAINTTSSFGYEMKEIQRRDPRVWESMLKTDLSREPLWNPMLRRPPLLGEPNA